MVFSDIICLVLKFYGCDTVFGVPGALIDPIWKSLHKHGFKIITCTNECDAAYIANAYSKITRKISLVITTGCPGVTNAVSGLASANKDSSPIVFISGMTSLVDIHLGFRQAESPLDRSFVSTSLTQSICKKNYLLDNPITAVKEFIEGCSIAQEKRKGVVHFCIPLNLQKQIMKVEKGMMNKAFLIDNKDYLIKNSNNRRPLIVIGWGVYCENCISELYDLSETINAPVLVTSKGISCEKYLHPMYLGKLGYGYNAILHQFLLDYSPDLIYIFGSSCGSKDFNLDFKNVLDKSKDIYVFSCEDETLEYRLPKANKIICSDLSSIVRQLMQGTIWGNDANRIKSQILNCKIKQEEYFLSKIDECDLMANCIIALDRIIRENDCFITADAGNNLIDATVLLNPIIKERVFYDFGIRAMGNGVCTGIGISLANPTIPVINIVGDGGMLMNGNSIYLASRNKLPIVFVVFNNSSLGRIRIAYKADGDSFSTDISTVDFCHYASAFSIESAKVKNLDEFIFCVKYALELHHPFLLEVVTDSDEIPVILKGAY